MHFNVYEFDLQVVHEQVDGYMPAARLLGVVNRVSFGNGYCTLSNRNLERMAKISPRQRETAIRKLKEANLIEVEARFGDDGRRLPNKIVRTPITREQLQAYADTRAMKGLDNTIEIRLSNGDMIPGLHESMFADDVPDVIEGEATVDPMDVSMPRTPESTPPSRQRGGPPSPPSGGGGSKESQAKESQMRSCEREARAAQPRSRSNTTKLTNCACAREETSDNSPPPRTSRGSGQPQTDGGHEDDNSTEEQPLETLHRWLVSLVSNHDGEIGVSDMKSPPASGKNRRKMEKRIEELGGVEKAFEFLKWTLDKGLGWLVNFHWFDFDVYVLLCGGAVRHWKIQSGMIEQQKIKTPEMNIRSQKEAEKQRKLQKGEWVNEDGESEDDGVWR